MVLFMFFSVRQVFKDLDFFGWYTTGGNPCVNDVKVHRQVRTLFISLWNEIEGCYIATLFS